MEEGASSCSLQPVSGVQPVAPLKRALDQPATSAIQGPETAAKRPATFSCSEPSAAVSPGAKEGAASPAGAPAEGQAVEQEVPSASLQPEEAAAQHGASKAEAAPAPAAPLPLLPAPKVKPPRLQARSFYSNNRLQQVEDRILRFLANVQARLATSSSSASALACWELFPVQQPAFDFADQHNGEEGGSRLRVFSVETGPEGRRRFLVTSYAELWRRYRNLLPQHRHYYEIIRQGWPCHLYFDLEYQVAENPGVDGATAVDALLSLVAELLKDKFGLEYEESWALELDSSTPAKFSRHVIVRTPGTAFASNAHAGAFVRELVARAAERRGADPGCPEARLFVKKAGGEEALFVDLGVYTRNRAFRLYLSSKAGKEAVLTCTGRFGGGALSQQEVFQAGLICDVDPSAALLRCFEEAEGPAGAAWGPAGTAGAALRRLGGGGYGTGGQHAVHYGPSPYPLLEEFIASICKQGGGGARDSGVRSWASLDGGSLLLFNIRGSRWCGNLGREHKSNGVFYVVDLQQGWWCQRCYDPDCRSYRSPLTTLPEDLRALYQQPAGPAPSQQQQQQQPPPQQRYVDMQQAADACGAPIEQPPAVSSAKPPCFRNVHRLLLPSEPPSPPPPLPLPPPPLPPPPPPQQQQQQQQRGALVPADLRALFLPQRLPQQPAQPHCRQPGQGQPQAQPRWRHDPPPAQQPQSRGDGGQASSQAAAAGEHPQQLGAMGQRGQPDAQAARCSAAGGAGAYESAADSGWGGGTGWGDDDDLTDDIMLAALQKVESQLQGRSQQLQDEQPPQGSHYMAQNEWPSGLGAACNPLNFL